MPAGCFLGSGVTQWHVIAGKRLGAVSGASLRRLLELIDKAKAFIEPCCNPGERFAPTLDSVNIWFAYFQQQQTAPRPW